MQKKRKNNALLSIEAKTEATLAELLDDLMAAMGEMSIFDTRPNAAMRVNQAMLKSQYEERFRKIIEAASVASANETLGTFAIAQADKYFRWRLSEAYNGVTLSQTLRHNARETAEILTYTIRAQLQQGTTWTQLARKIQTHDKVSDVAVTIAELAKAAKKMGIDPTEVRQLARKAQRYINTMSPNDAPTLYLKRAYQNMIDTVQKTTDTANINKALGKAMDAKIKYNAQRISRTEIARASNEAFHARYDDDERVTGFQWVLSSRHNVTDECTMMAELDNGAGPGVYRKDDFPQLPVHPNCMCMKEPYFGEPPEKTRFTTVRDYLLGKTDKERYAIIGKRDGQHQTLYRRGLEARGIHLHENPKKVPVEFLAKKMPEGLISEAGGGILSSGEDGAAVKASFVPAESIADAQKYAKDTFGIDADYSKYQIDVANAVNEEILKMQGVFGEGCTTALHKVGALSERCGREVYGQYRYNAETKLGTLNLRVQGGMEDILDTTEYAHKEGQWSTSDVRHIMRHELGHAIHQSLLKSHAGIDELSEIKLMRESIETDERNRHKAYKREHRGEKITWGQWKNREYPKYLSIYGIDENHWELIAESVAEYMGGSPRETSLRVVALLIAALNGGK